MKVFVHSRDSARRGIVVVGAVCALLFSLFALAAHDHDHDASEHGSEAACEICFIVSIDEASAASLQPPWPGAARSDGPEASFLSVAARHDRLARVRDPPGAHSA
ncbi:MAG: hypothetical protein AAFU65_10125 [Pseudomonadota bacterium]